MKLPEAAQARQEWQTATAVLIGAAAARHNRRVSNGDQVSRVAALAMKRGKSVDFTGYWQRHIAN
jgi:hypothetical protein